MSKKAKRIRGDAGAYFTVALPFEGFEGHVKRIERQLEALGYAAVPLRGEDMVRIGRDVERQIAEFEQAEQALSAAAAQPLEDTPNAP